MEKTIMFSVVKAPNCGTAMLLFRKGNTPPSFIPRNKNGTKMK
jgi:hypothetical protein